MQALSAKKKKIKDFMDRIASKREEWVARNHYYYESLAKGLEYNISEDSSVLEIGCGTGQLLHRLNVKEGVGIDISPEMIKVAQEKYPQYKFLEMDAENIELDQKFDFIVISDSVGYLEDIQKIFKELWKVSTPSTRIIITYHNFLWQPLLVLAELLRLRMPQPRINWVNRFDLFNLLKLENFEVIKRERKFFFPVYIPLISPLLNRYIFNLPLINRLCIAEYVIAKQAANVFDKDRAYSVSVVVPACNEKGNIEEAVKSIPQMGKHTEIIFIEGGSNDGTLEEIKRVCKEYSEKLDVKYAVQEGTGKGDAVRKGFDMASGDILMILDADLTVRPKELVKFYDAIATGKGEFINGSRLVYPVEKESMQLLNMIANKFFAMTFTWILGQPLKDTLCGTKVLFKKDYEKIVRNRSYFGMFDPFGDFDLIFGASKLNFKIVEVPISYKARTYGSTNISRFRHGLLLFRMTAFAMKKIKFV